MYFFLENGKGKTDMANGMAALYVGASGLRAAQDSINTTAHNLSNINTTGYTRQQITYNDSNYFTIGSNGLGNLQYGIGVDLTEIRRVRDEYLDRSYRTESGRTAFYESQYEAVEEVETLFDEMDGITLKSAIDDLWSALNEVAKNPGSTVTRTELVQTGKEFIDRATAIYDGLSKYQSMLNTKISNTVDRINELGQTVKDLNDQISAIEASGENANDLRDERDSALDELGALAKITCEEDSNNKVNITLEGVPFLAGNTLYTMSTVEIEGSDIVTPIWPQMSGRNVFLFNEEFNSINNNDIGELKGLLLARGNVAGADYRDVPVEPEKDDYTDVNGNFDEAAYNAAYDSYKQDVKYYNSYIDESVILTTMAGLDKLVNGMVTAINDVLCPEKASTEDYTVLDENGNAMTIPAGTTILDMDKTSYGMDGETVGVELFSRTYTDRYIKYELEQPLADGTKYIYVHNDRNSFGNESLYTLGNLEINDTVLQDYQTLPLGTKQKGEDFDKAEELLDLWSVEFAALNPTKYAKENFQSFYNSLVSETANRGEVLKNMVDYQQAMTDEIESKRNEMVSVSSDEELTNLIRFQNAYNASSRYINVVDEMLEHIVTRLGG